MRKYQCKACDIFSPEKDLATVYVKGSAIRYHKRLECANIISLEHKTNLEYKNNLEDLLPELKKWRLIKERLEKDELRKRDKKEILHISGKRKISREVIVTS